MSQYYPEHRFITDMTIIERKLRLPEEGIGQIQAAEGQRVDIRDAVARVMMPSPYVIIPAAKILGLRDPESLSRFMLVKNRVRVSEKDAIAGKDAKRGKRVFAPMNGIVVHVGDGKIIMQATPEVRNIDAGLRGRIARIDLPDTLHLEGSGGLIQGVWGNGRDVIAVMHMEPSQGIESIALNALDTTYRSEIIVTTRPINADMLKVALIRRFAGIIAPSAPANLLDAMRKVETAIILTEGFGELRMNSSITSLLQEHDGHQVTLSAVADNQYDIQRPEIVINRTPNTPPPSPNYHLTLRIGMQVRIVRAPYLGQFAKIVDLPAQPQTLPNGLRVMVAQVELFNGDLTDVPLSNLEVAGR